MKDFLVLMHSHGKLGNARVTYESREGAAGKQFLEAATLPALAQAARDYDGDAGILIEWNGRVVLETGDFTVEYEVSGLTLELSN